MAFTDSLTGSALDAAIDALLANDIELRKSFASSSSPASPVSGQIWIDTSGASAVLKVYGDLEGTGAAWYEVSRVLHGSMLGGNNQLVDIRLENKSSHTTPASGVVGEVYLLTTDGKARLVVSATVREVLLSASNADNLAVDAFSSLRLDATNPPTAGTKGSTPTVRGWLFDAANELASFCVRVPAGYSADADVKIRLECVLNQAESSGDDIDWTADYVVRAPASAELVSDTSSSATAAKDMSTHVAEGAWHYVDIALPYNDATNPIAAGDLLCVEIHRTDLANCGGVIVVGAQVLFPVGTKITE